MYLIDTESVNDIRYNFDLPNTLSKACEEFGPGNKRWRTVA